MLWLITKHKLSDEYAEFDDGRRYFKVNKNPYYNSRYGYKRHIGEYYLDKNAVMSERYRVKCSLAQTIIYEFMYVNNRRYGSVCFNLSGHTAKFSNLEPLIGKSGYLTLHNMEIIYNDRRDSRLVFAGFCDDGKVLDQKQMQRIFDLSGEKEQDSSYKAEDDVTEKLKSLYAAEQERILEEISIQNSNYFEEETAKLAKWSKDIKIGIERTLRETDKAIDEVNVQLRGRQMPLQKRLELQEQLAVLEPKKKELRMKIYEEQDKIDDERNRLIDETKKKLTQKVESKLIFTVKWRII